METSKIKNFFLIKFIIIAMMVVGTFFNTTLAQNISYPTPAQSLTRGLDSSFLTVRIDFPNCFKPEVTINLGATNSPGIIQYVTGSLIQTGGNGPLITEANLLDLRNPVFLVTSTTPGQFIEFKIKRRAFCGTSALTKDVVKVSGACNFNESLPTVNSYVLYTPALTLVPPANISNAIVGNAYNRTISVTNGGTGCLDTLGFWIKYSPGSLQLNSLKIGATIITPSYTSADSIYFKIAGNLLSSDKLLCNGETVTFTENVTVLKCAANAEYGDAWYSHLGNACEFDVAQGGITFSNALPNLKAELITPDPYNYCYSLGETKKQFIRIVNTGGGAASQVKLTLKNYVPGSFTGNVYFDTSVSWAIKKTDGTVLGTVKNFKAVSSALIYNSSCATSVGLINEGIGELTNNIIIAGGDTVIVEVQTVPYYLGCIPNYCTDVWGWLGIQSKLDYQSQCGVGVYSEPLKTIAARAYNYFQYSVNHPSDVNGFGPNNYFTIDLFFSQFRTINHPDGSGSTYLILPLLGTGIQPNCGVVNFAGYTFPVNFINDTMKIGPIPQNIGYLPGGNMSIPMVANCSAGNGARALNFAFLNKYGACSPIMKIGCRQSTISVHCPTGCLKGGASPTWFNLKRINHGVPDNNEDHIPDVGGSISYSQIQDHHAVNGDTLLGTWKINIVPNIDPTDVNFGKPVKFVYLDFEASLYGYAIGSATTLSPLPYAVASIFPAGGGYISCNITPTIVGTKIHYEINTGCRGGDFKDDDYIIFETKYLVHQYNADAYGGVNAAGFDLFRTNNEVYAAYTQKTTPQLAPLAGQTYTCEHYNDYSELSRIWISPWMYPGQAINGCDNLIAAYIRSYTRNQEYGDIFPYEYRNFYIPDEFRVQIPPNFTYRPNSAYLDAVANSIANADVSQIGDTLYFKNLRKFFTKFGGTLLGGDETDSRGIFFKVDAPCAATTALYNGGTKTIGIGNGYNTPSANYFYDPTYYPATGIYNYTAPQPFLSGGGSSLSADGTGTWNVVLQNQSNLVNAENEYFYFSPTNGLINIVVKEGATVITPDANGFYRLGTLLANAVRSFTVTAKSTNCSDVMRINSAWSCSGYPTAFNPTTCNQFAWLSLTGYPSQIQLSVAKQPIVAPATNLSLCSSSTAEFLMNSAQASFAENPIFAVTPPVGLLINSATIEYPDGSGNIQTITPTINLGVYSYAVKSHTGVPAIGLPGTIFNPSPAGRSARLRLNFTTDCSFISGSKIAVQQKANRPCGGPIPNSLGFDDIVRTDPIKILNALDTGSLVFNVGLSSSVITCGNASKITGSIIPTLTNTGASDTATVFLPNGINFVGNYTGAPNATLIGSTVLPGGSTLVKIKIANGIAVGTNISYSFDVTASSTKNCNSYSILSEAERTFPPLLCGATFCSASAKVIIGSTINNITVQKPIIQISNFTKLPGGNFSPGNTVNVNVLLQNMSTTNAAPANSITIDFYCSSSSTPFASALFPNPIPVSSSSDANFTINIANAPFCNGGDIIRAVVKPSAASCVCDSVSFQLLGAVLPIKVKTFTANKVNKTAQLIFTTVNYFANTTCVIESSVDGINFAAIGSMVLTAIEENKFTDANPTLGSINYYRIKFIQQNGQINYSDIKKVNFGSTDLINIYPSPAKNLLTIELPKNLDLPSLSIQLFDATGSIVMSKKWNSTSYTQQFDITAVATGTYFLKISDKKLANSVHKVVVSK
jgi:Secretion system C-terminal sorting domain